MSRMKIFVSLGAAVVVTILASLAAIQTTGDTELRDLDVKGWDCVNQSEGTAQTQEAKERNRMKNRWPVNLSVFTVESLETAEFLKKVREYDSRLQSTYRSELTGAQKDELDSYENQMCLSQVGLCWLMLARQKQQTAAVPTSMTGILRFLKMQAITHRRSVIRRQSFVR
jgi:hypothetical protein